MPEMQSCFVDRLNAIVDLYIQVKEVIIFLEKNNKGSYSFVGPHNEVRNAFDHVMKMTMCMDDVAVVERQYNGAKGHLLRAGYDAYELLCGNRIRYIYDIMSEFQASDVNNGFPEYYQNGIRGGIEQVQKDLAEYRMEHPAGSSEHSMGKHTLDEWHEVSEIEKVEQRYNRYFASFKQLSGYSNELDKHISAISDFKVERVKKEEHERKKEEERERVKSRNTIIAIAIAGATLIVGIVGVIVAFLSCK
ncbi:MAG: hypothetical protein LBL94_11010 [Prevotellaceae bacterium]|jgi:hypothetical protein|nr:hypothetical protein [Prevotellaceae bacterium]